MRPIQFTPAETNAVAYCAAFAMQHSDQSEGSDVPFGFDTWDLFNQAISTAMTKIIETMPPPPKPQELEDE